MDFWLFKEGEGEPYSWLPLWIDIRGMRLAILYLVVIAGVEVVTNFFDVVGGLICHTILLTALIVHSSLVAEDTSHKLLLALCLAPLTRIMSLSMPLVGFPLIYWYLIIYPPLFLAAWVAMRRLNFTARETGLTVRKLPLQLVVGLSGVIFGVGEYLILRPEPLVPELTWGKVVLAVLALGVGTGFVEEFVFRGVLQRSAVEAFGRWGVVYVSLLFAILHIGFLSGIDVAFVFAVALFFSWVVQKTGSLLGVTLSHGLTNIMLYLIVPFLLG